jgi:hypothetical protein
LLSSLSSIKTGEKNDTLKKWKLWKLNAIKANTLV